MDKKTETKMKASAMEAALKRYAPTQMTFWHDEVRAIANELTRCALISCRTGRTPRKHFHNEKLFTLGKDAAITITGEELRGNDEDVFLTLAHLARELPSGGLVVTVKSSEICKLNKWETRQVYYTEIYKSILRLSSTTLTIYSRRLTKMLAYEKARKAGTSKEELARMYDEIHALSDDELVGTELSGLFLSMVMSNVQFTGGKSVVNDIPQGDLEWEIPLDEKMMTLFAKEWLTLVPTWSRHRMSTGARRLQAYFLGHREPYPVKISTLAGLLQLDSASKEQKRIVRERLRELTDNGVLKEVRIEEGLGDVLVHVVRSDWGGQPNDAPGKLTG